MASATHEAKALRLSAANRFIASIASHGRNFFNHEGRVARLEIVRGQVYFVDHYTQKHIYTHYSGEWRGFSSGGTMRDLVIKLRDYVCGRAPGLPLRSLGPWPEWMCGGDPWGYGDAMAAVRAECLAIHQESAP